MSLRLASVAGLLLLLATLSARADSPGVTASVPRPPTSQEGLAIGVELGEPTSLTLGWWTGKLGLAAAIGTGTLQGVGLSMHADVQLEVARLSPAVALAVGLGGRIYHHGYELMSFDEVPDTHYGVRASLALAYERGALRLYAEVAPGVDVIRTGSCTLASGPYSICPHAQELPVFAQVVIGARWFFSH